MIAIIQTVRIDAMTRLEPAREAFPTHRRECVGEKPLPPGRDLVGSDQFACRILVAFDQEPPDRRVGEFILLPPLGDQPAKEAGPPGGQVGQEIRPLQIRPQLINLPYLRRQSRFECLSDRRLSRCGKAVPRQGLRRTEPLAKSALGPFGKGPRERCSERRVRAQQMKDEARGRLRIGADLGGRPPPRSKSR